MSPRIWKKRFKSLITVFMIAALVLVGTGCGSQGTTSSNNSSSASNGSSTSKAPYKIGAVLDITGGASSLGVPERDALKMLVDKINANGGVDGHQIELKIYDNESNESKSVLAVKKAIEDDKVDAVIGGSQSSTSLAMVDTIEKSQIPYISLGSHISIIDGKKWTFKTPPNDSINAKILMSYAQKQGWKNIALMAPNNAFGDSGKAGLQAAIQGTDMKIVAEARFNADSKDMTVELTKLKQANPDVIVTWSILPAAAIAVTNYDQLGLKGKIPYLGNTTLASQQFLDLAGKAAEGITFVGSRFMIVDQLPDSDPLKAVTKEYVTEYQKLYGPPNQAGGNSYDAMLLLAEALKQAGTTDKAKVRDALESIKELKATNGVFNMKPNDHNGLDTRAMVIIRVDQGKFKLVQ